MPSKKKSAKGAERTEARADLAAVFAQEVMPPCSQCTRAKEACRLRVGQGACVRCTEGGRKCDLFLTCST